MKQLVRLVKFDGRMSGGYLKAAFIKSRVTINENDEYVRNRTLQIEFHDAPTMYVHTDIYDVPCGTDLDEEDEELMREFLDILYNNAEVDYDKCLIQEID